MSSAWLSAAIQEFEQVTLDNGTELFLVRARAQREDDPEPRPMFETRERDGTAHTYEPLSSGGDRRGLLRLAYAVPTERVGPSTTFSLRLPDGYRIELPEPTPGDSVAEPDDDKTWQGVDPSAANREPPEPDDGAAWQIAKLEQELELTRQSVARLTARLRQLEARNELLRADATGGQAGDGERLRQLESEREQLATHVRALAELLSSETTSVDAAVDVESGGAADHLETIRARAVREANAHAERELHQLRAGSPL